MEKIETHESIDLDAGLDFPINPASAAYVMLQVAQLAQEACNKAVSCGRLALLGFSFHPAEEGKPARIVLKAEYVEFTVHKKGDSMFVYPAKEPKS